MARSRNTPDADARALVERLRDTREYLGLSQQFVAEQTGIPRSAISDIERGERRVESIELKRLSKLYRYPVEYFLGSEATENESADADTIQALARAAGDLTQEDREQVLKFADFLRHYRNSPEGK
jgi:transcriptional regulator with XRE-family HTH domain